MICSVCATPTSNRLGSTWCSPCEAWVLDAAPPLPPQVIDLRDPADVQTGVLIT